MPFIIYLFNVLVKNRKLLFSGVLTLVVVLIGLYVRFKIHSLNNEVEKYKTLYQNKVKEIEVLKANIKEEKRKNKLLQEQLSILKENQNKIKDIQKQSNKLKSKIIKQIPKNRLRLSRDEQTKVIETINNILSDF